MVIKCIKCGSENVARERRMHGDDTCRDCGAKYPSRLNGKKIDSLAYVEELNISSPIANLTINMVNELRAKHFRIAKEARENCIKNRLHELTNIEKFSIIMFSGNAKLTCKQNINLETRTLDLVYENCNVFWDGKKFIVVSKAE